MDPKFDLPQLASIAAAIPDPCLVVDLAGEIVSANAQATNFFESEVTGKHLTVALRAPAILQAVNEANRNAVATNVGYAIRFPVPRNLDVHISPLGFDFKNERLSLVILHDLTHEEQVERMRADFVANASHELRTPLSSISGFIETMQGSAKYDPEARDKFLGVMKAQADRMALLIDDLLSLSRIEITEHIAPHESADLVKIAKQACDLLQPTAKEAGCEIQFDLPEAMPVIGDSRQLSQVVHNLIENAIKYGGSGKFIEVEGYQNGESSRLSVRDFGPGIAPQHVPRLTERFYRVNVQDSRTRGGTGLGLAIAKHIVNRHRGRLTVESEVGKGSLFTIYIPIKTQLNQ